MPGGTVIGDPAYDMKFWHHQSHNDCDIVCQQMGLESLTRKHFSESALLHEAVHDKTHFNGGTSSEYIGHLFEKHGFPIERHHDATLQELTEKLTEGHKIVAAVNSELLWNTGLHDSHTLAANHSVEVIGLLYPDNGSSPMVILNDPGIENGRGIMIPLEQFEHAWGASNHLIASAHSPDIHASLLKDSQNPSQIIGSAGLGDGNRYIYPTDSQQVIDAKKWANQYEQNREQQQRAAEENQRERARIEAEERAREARIREEQQRQEERRREEMQREQQRQERERQQREQEQREQQHKEEQRRAEMQREQQRQEQERQQRN
jgi:hypothetical protein